MSSGIDLSAITQVELVGTSDRGRLWVIDLAGVSAPLPAVPVERVPVVDLGRLRVQEGGPGTHVAQVPFTVSGHVSRTGEFFVYGFTSHDDTGTPVRRTVAVAPGSTGGTIDWEYTGDNRDSYPKTFYELIGHASHDVMLRDGSGTLVVVDDDPTPKVTFRAVRSHAREGGSAVFRATLSQPAGFEHGRRAVRRARGPLGRAVARP